MYDVHTVLITARPPWCAGGGAMVLGSGLCDQNPDPISDHSTPVFSCGLLIRDTFF